MPENIKEMPANPMERDKFIPSSFRVLGKRGGTKDRWVPKSKRGSRLYKGRDSPRHTVCQMDDMPLCQCTDSKHGAIYNAIGQ